MRTLGVYWLLLGIGLGWFCLPDAKTPTPANHPQRPQEAAQPGQFLPKPASANLPLDTLEQELIGWSQRMETKPEETLAEVSQLPQESLRQFLEERLWAEWMQRDPAGALRWFKTSGKAQESCAANNWRIAVCCEASRAGAVAALEWVEKAQSFLPFDNRDTPVELLSLLLKEAPNRLAERTRSNRISDIDRSFSNLMCLLKVNGFNSMSGCSTELNYGPFRHHHGWSQFLGEQQWEEVAAAILPGTRKSDDERASDWTRTGEYLAAEWMAYHPESAKRWLEKALNEKDELLTPIIMEFTRSLPPKDLLALFADPRLDWVDSRSLSHGLAESLKSYPQLEEAVLAAPHNHQILKSFAARGFDYSDMRYAGDWSRPPLLLDTPKILNEITLHQPDLISDNVREAQVYLLTEDGDYENAKTWADQMDNPDLRILTLARMGWRLPDSATKDLWELVQSEPELRTMDKLQYFAPKFMRYNSSACMDLVAEAYNRSREDWLLEHYFNAWLEEKPRESLEWLDRQPAGAAKDQIQKKLRDRQQSQ